MEVNFNTILEDGSPDELGELLVREQKQWIFYSNNDTIVNAFTAA